MFNWLVKKTTQQKQQNPAQTQTAPVSPGNPFLRNEEGFWIPQSAEVLLSTPKRQRWLQQIASVVALPDKEYRSLCLSPLKRLAECLQCVPAGRTGHYQGEGGLLDLTLHTTAWCVRMSQKEMLPRGVPAEEQSRQFSAWNVCVFYTGLLYWLPLTSLFDGQLNTLRPWYPGLSRPAVPFRFRFHEMAPDIRLMRQTQGALRAIRLLPTDAIDWLSGYPRALQALTEVVTGQVDIDNDLMRILNEALGAFEPGSLPDITPATETLFPGETNRTGSNISATVQPEPISAMPAPQTGQREPTALLTAQSPAEAPLPEMVSDSQVSFQLASPDEAKIPASSEPSEGIDPVDKLVPPDEDLHYALMLSGALPSQGVEDNETMHATGEAASQVVPISEDGESRDTDSKSGLLQAAPQSMESNAVTKENSSGSLITEVDKTRPVNDVNLVSASVPADVLAADFVGWLSRSLSEKTLAVNAPGGSVHVIAGYLFLRSPHIFTLYLSQCPYTFERYIPVQRAFESLNLHRRNGKSGGLVHCRLQYTASDEGKPVWQKAAGYLVKSRKWLSGENGNDSPYIEFE